MKKLKTAMIVILVIIVVAAGITVWQYDNINAAIKAFSYSQNEISEMMSENKEKLENELKEKLPEMVSDFSPEDEKKIMTGEMTIEEAIKKKEIELEEKLKTEKKQNNEANKKTNEIVSKKVIEFYSLKAYYLGQLGQLEAKVIADYSKLPAEKKNLVGKKEIAGKYLSVATGLLNQCDAKVDSLLKELEKDIKAVGGDLSVISTIKNHYENEKNLKKAYYMSKLK